MNKVILMGRLVADPEFSMSQTGMPICHFRIAVDRDFVRQGEQKQSDFFRITCFGKNAEFVNQYFVKGKPALIEGKIQNDNYTDKNGVQQYREQIIADRVNFLLSDPTRTNNGQSYGNGYNNSNNYGYNNNYSNNGNGYQNNNYGGYGNGNSYNNNGYNGNNYSYQNNGGNYQQPVPQNPAPQIPVSQQPASPPKDIQLGDGDISDFEEIISDGQVPF